MLMTKAAHSRHTGVSRQTVYDRIKKGELVLVGRKIDVRTSSQNVNKRYTFRGINYAFGGYCGSKNNDKKTYKSMLI
jgi:hypothetical protein